ncbi:hypothetical protein TNCV_601991 [Trichonephila clavipes]|nr:hypothetical protein TNCV_601991 [Trichonephila clavipes]
MDERLSQICPVRDLNPGPLAYKKGGIVYYFLKILRCVVNVVPAPFDDVGDQERIVLLPEEVGKKGFLESSPPTFRDRLL